MSIRQTLILAVCLMAVAGCDDDDTPTTIIVAEDAAVVDAAPTTHCNDGVDNDLDGFTDLDDPGCVDAADDDELDPPLPQCSNGVDDDEDGDTDMDDPGCSRPTDDDESDDPTPPQCDDDLDNDADGFIDFPQDPGCGSLLDDNEGDETTVLPQCGDGIDNDNDGRVDLADPGCTSPADPREIDPDEAPPCSNQLDDDEDGLTDFPFDPGCNSAGDDTEENQGTPPMCGNGLDDDHDGEIDYPFDPGCAGVGDRDETDPPVVPACSDGQDNDRDGRTDFPDDHGCDSAADGSEVGACGAEYDPAELHDGQVIRGDTRLASFLTQGSCGGVGAPEQVFFYRLEHQVEQLVFSTDHADTEVESVLYLRRTCLNEASEVACSREPHDDGVAANTLTLDAPAIGDYYLFLDGAAGRGGRFALNVNEVPLPQCRNYIDDDADGRTDYPVDPGCLNADDRDETDPDVPPACADDEDNDGDGLIDYPLDRGCQAASDPDEVDFCGQGVPVVDYPVGEPFVMGDTSRGGSNAFNGSCGGAGSPETIFRYINPFNANLRFSVMHEDTIVNTLIYVRTGCRDGQELDCDSGFPPESQGQVDVNRATPGDYFVIVDHPFGLGGEFRLTVESERLPPGCSDGLDNDGDGYKDSDDPGCASPDDEDERDPVEDPVCWNTLDDDEDGLTDYPYDPGCATKGDESEVDPAVAPQCSNGIDDDEDETIDFPVDLGCAAMGDDQEENRLPPECQNRMDDDGDGLTDYPLDPGCAAPGDLSETDGDRAPACTDEIDNDRDGLVDFPYDPGCVAAGHFTEVNPEAPYACSDEVDNDDDGVIDFPRDPGCAFAADDNETDPGFPPQCANGRDDDGNGRTDWPDDPGCAFAADPREEASGPVRPRCADGVDNDDDGLIDLSDLGCAGAQDNDETDLAEVPWCADGVDNDEDGVTDWPEDDGCAAQGDACEQQSYGLCEGVCLDLVADPLNCGICGRVCDEGVECIDGFCGGLYAFEGIRQDVPDADLGGWTVCHADHFGDSGANLPQIRAACNGEFVMWGCRPSGSPTWNLLAMGERDEVFTNTGDNNHNVHTHNGVDWYYSEGYSMGFVDVGAGVARNSCDTMGDPGADLRMCWHTGAGGLNGGYRCGATMGLNGAANWDRVIWTSR